MHWSGHDDSIRSVARDPSAGRLFASGHASQGRPLEKPSRKSWCSPSTSWHRLGVATLDHRLRGALRRRASAVFYRVDEGAPRLRPSTQFEPNDARRAFPCLRRAGQQDARSSSAHPHGLPQGALRSRSSRTTRDGAQRRLPDRRAGPSSLSKKKIGRPLPTYLVAFGSRAARRRDRWSEACRPPVRLGFAGQGQGRDGQAHRSKPRRRISSLLAQVLRPARTRLSKLRPHSAAVRETRRGAGRRWRTQTPGPSSRFARSCSLPRSRARLDGGATHHGFGRCARTPRATSGVGDALAPCNGGTTSGLNEAFASWMSDNESSTSGDRRARARRSVVPFGGNVAGHVGYGPDSSGRHEPRQEMPRRSPCEAPARPTEVRFDGRSSVVRQGPAVRVPAIESKLWLCRGTYLRCRPAPSIGQEARVGAQCNCAAGVSTRAS